MLRHKLGVEELKRRKRADTLSRASDFSNGDHSSASAVACADCAARHFDDGSHRACRRIGASKASAFQWFLLRASLRTQFPGAEWITTRELADLLEDLHRVRPFLLDVRTVEGERESSSRARRVDPGASAEIALLGAGRDVPVVTYPYSKFWGGLWRTASGRRYN